MALPGLIVEIEGRVDKLEKALKRANKAQGTSATAMERRAKQSADKINSTYGAMGDKITGAFKKLGPGLVAGLSIGAVAAITSQMGSVVRAIAEIGDAAKIAGVSVERFQQLKFVATENRVEIDALTDGLKELSLRADEFVVTGGGSAADAFKRLGYGAADLSSKLDDPAALFAEIIDRMNDLDKAAQIRVSDEIFGGSGGEQFVQLMGQGEGAIQATMDRAKEAGAVLDADLIKKAEDLDRRFAALQTRTSTFFKSLVIEVADAGAKITGLSSDVDDLFRTAHQADGLLGPGVVAELDASADAAGDNAVVIGQLRQQYEGLSDQSVVLAPQLEMAAVQLRAFGEADAAAELATVAGEMRTLSNDMLDGTVSAEDFEAQLQALVDRAGDAFTGLADIDRVTFSGVIGAIGGIGSALTRAIELARSLRASLPGAAPNGVATPVTVAKEAGSFWDDPANMNAVNPRSTPALTSIPRPKAAPRDIDFGMPPLPDDKPAGGGKAAKAGGGSAKAERLTDYQREIAAIAEETAALNLEASALGQVTGAQARQGDAIELARTKAELLAAAQRSGLEVTPELTAKVDQLAQGYQDAGIAADEAAKRIETMQNAGRESAEAIGSVFASLAAGRITAKQALQQMLVDFAKYLIKKAIMAAAEKTGNPVVMFAAAAFTSSFADGGYTGPGRKYEPAGTVHKGEFVMSKEATARLGVPQLNALHESAKRGYAGGGLVGGSASGKGMTLPVSKVSAAPVITINAPIKIEGGGGSPDQNKDLAKQMSKELDATVRRTIQSEIMRQKRPGNLLAGS
ncbi:MAG: hypothetical protein ACJAQU_000318 [Loktanella salsilacus]|jgi:hypothetical protein